MKYLENLERNSVFICDLIRNKMKFITYLITILYLLLAKCQPVFPKS